MSKLISVSDDVYTTLKEMKGEESYSVAIRKLFTPKSNKEKILSFYGKGGIDKEMIKEVQKSWKQWSEKYV
ncbi:MAG: antitoxin VapB family protein [Candidatus Woesearchaeota archaeon]|nr:antitoxin VapB family protein [Candidatus Woesearchaeota archaeon]